MYNNYTETVLFYDCLVLILQAGYESHHHSVQGSRAFATVSRIITSFFVIEIGVLQSWNENLQKKNSDS